MPSSTRRDRPISKLLQTSSNISVAHEVLKHVAQILLDAGHSRGDLAAQFARACDDAEQSGRECETAIKDYATRLTEIPSRWTRHPDYLDDLGRPLALTLKGGGRNLSHLIRSVFPEADVHTVVRSLVKSRAIRQRGRMYVVVERYVSFAEEALLAQAHALDAAALLLQTAQRNISARTPEERLLERNASNDSIPLHTLPVIRQRFREDMGALLDRFDAYLQDFAVAPGSEPTARVVLGAYAAEIHAVKSKPTSSGRSRSPRAQGVRR